jgi:hypothetical protein
LHDFSNFSTPVTIISARNSFSWDWLWFLWEPWRVTGDQLAAVLAERFGQIVPPGFHVEVEDGLVAFWADEALGLPGQTGEGPGRSGSWVRINFELPPGSVNERLVAAGEWALSDLQDYVDEATTEPWPGVRKPPAVHAAIRDGQLRLWFADGETTILECEPIDLIEADV